MLIKRHLSNLPENLFHQLRRPPELPRLPPAEERFPLLGQEGASKEENKYHFPWRNHVSVRITSSYSIFHLGPFCLEPTEDLVGRRLDDQTNIGCWSYNLHFDPLAEKLCAS